MSTSRPMIAESGLAMGWAGLSKSEERVDVAEGRGDRGERGTEEGAISGRDGASDAPGAIAGAGSGADTADEALCSPRNGAGSRFEGGPLFGAVAEAFSGD
jgi:hypothetical protein